MCLVGGAKRYADQLRIRVGDKCKQTEEPEVGNFILVVPSALCSVTGNLTPPSTKPHRKFVTRCASLSVANGEN